MLHNYHTHTWRCNHAEGREDAYVGNAVKAGLKTMGFSDHGPYFFPGDYYSRFRMRPEQLKDYCDTVLLLQKKYADRIQIPLGLEMEFYPDLFLKLLPFLQDHGVEYLLLGQHFVGNEIGEHYSGLVTTEESVLRKYCFQTMDALQTGLFSYFAHPDLLNFKGPEGIYRRYMRQICREAKSCGIPLEINLLGIREGRNYPNPLFWEMAAEEGCRVVLGCDAHAPEHILEQEAEKKALQIVKEYDLMLLQEVTLVHI